MLRQILLYCAVARAVAVVDPRAPSRELDVDPWAPARELEARHGKTLDPALRVAAELNRSIHEHFDARTSRAATLELVEEMLAPEPLRGRRVIRDSVLLLLFGKVFATKRFLDHDIKHQGAWRRVVGSRAPDASESVAAPPRAPRGSSVF